MRLLPDFPMTAYRSCCYICGSDARGKPVLDIERSLDDIPMDEPGADIMFCGHCAEEIIPLYQGLSADAAEKLRAENASLKDQAVNLKRELAEQTERVIGAVGA